MDRMNRIFDYVKSYMNWNKRYGMSAASGIARPIAKRPVIPEISIYCLPLCLRKLV